jgi:hypothetical protein
MNYSPKEHTLIEHFGFSDVADSMEPPVLYRVMAEKAFCEDMRGDAVDSLRRCLTALNRSSCFRMTEEWDEMIST